MTERFTFKGWYEEHGGELNAARRQRYQSDPAYRERVLERNRESRARKRVEAQAERAAQAAARKVHAPGPEWKAVDLAVEVAGRPVQLKTYTIGVLAWMLKRSIQAVRLWERQGVIPRTPYRNEKNDRLYTWKQVQEIYNHLLALGKVEGKPLDDTPDPPPEVMAEQRPADLPPVFERRVQFADGTTRQVPLYKVGVLAEALGRTIVTVEQMEHRGVLPATPFRGGSTGYRLYTKGMIAAVRAAYAAVGGEIRGETDRAAFHAAVTEAWQQLGVVGARLVPEPRRGGKKGATGGERMDPEQTGG